MVILMIFAKHIYLVMNSTINHVMMKANGNNGVKISVGNIINKIANIVPVLPLNLVQQGKI